MHILVRTAKRFRKVITDCTDKIALVLNRHLSLLTYLSVLSSFPLDSTRRLGVIKPHKPDPHAPLGTKALHHDSCEGGASFPTLSLPEQGGKRTGEDECRDV